MEGVTKKGMDGRCDEEREGWKVWMKQIVN